MFKKPEFSMRNEKPKRKNQDSADGMGNFPSRDLFAYAVNTYGTSFTQTYVIRQLSKVFYKSSLFFAKQSQFQKSPNECKLTYDKGL